eukprot:scaffold110839_cov60-Phaeocystis_antarctica.AAC.6
MRRPSSRPRAARPACPRAPAQPPRRGRRCAPGLGLGLGLVLGVGLGLGLGLGLGVRVSSAGAHGRFEEGVEHRLGHSVQPRVGGMHRPDLRPYLLEDARQYRGRAVLVAQPVSEIRPIWLDSATQEADRPRLAAPRHHPGHPLALVTPAQRPSGRTLMGPVFDIARGRSHSTSPSDQLLRSCTPARAAPLRRRL